MAPIWSAVDVSTVIDLLRYSPGRWWLSGGVAIDEYLGFVSRPHGDIDVTVAREDWPAVQEFLDPVLEIWIARDGQLHSARSTSLLPGDHNIWARWPGGGPWRLQLNLEDISGDVWRYRRDHRVTRPVAEASWRSSRVTCISPAVQLLWKAKGPLPKDEHDYQLVVPRLLESERRWLGDAIRLAHPSSPWSARAEFSG